MGHNEYLAPFLFGSLFRDGHCYHSVDVIIEGCEFMTVWVVGRKVYCDVYNNYYNY